MGTPNPLIKSVSTPEYMKVVIEASDGICYYADLSSLQKVYCFPKIKAEWDQVSSDSYGLTLVWSSRFEVHMDQIIGLTYKKERSQRSA